MQTTATPPEVTLFIATGCAHCPAVLQGLSELLKQGAIRHLEVTNITVLPEAARTRGVRSVPWLQIGPFELHGSYTPKELRQWVERAATDQGVRDYLAELIENRRLEEALRRTASDPHWLSLAVGMLGDLDTPMGVRIGIGALLEDLAHDERYRTAETELKKLLQAPQAPVRADAAYYLGLSPNPAARDWLQPLLEDEDAEVREIAREALDTGAA